MKMIQQAHWERVYATSPPDKLGWYTPHLTTSLEWIGQLHIDPDAPIIDVGAGVSLFVDDLLEAGYRSITVLDIAESALQTVRTRLGSKSHGITWLHADITTVKLPDRHYRLWHDRAVFHFLTAAEDRARYLDNLQRALQPGGYLIIGVFTPAAPPKCSGLPVQRYTAATLAAELGDSFTLQCQREQMHVTPGGVEQLYAFCEFRRN